MSKTFRTTLIALAALLGMVFAIVSFVGRPDYRRKIIPARTSQIIPDAVPYPRTETIPPYPKEQGSSPWMLVQ